VLTIVKFSHIIRNWHWRMAIKRVQHSSCRNRLVKKLEERIRPVGDLTWLGLVRRVAFCVKMLWRDERKLRKGIWPVENLWLQSLKVEAEN